MSACALVCSLGAVLWGVGVVISWPGLVRLYRAFQDLRNGPPQNARPPQAPSPPNRPTGMPRGPWR